MSHEVFILDKIEQVGNPYHGRIERRSSPSQRVIILPTATPTEVEIFGSNYGPLTWYFRHPDAVQTSNPSFMTSQGLAFFCDAIFCGETKTYSPSLQSGTAPVAIGDPNVWLRVCADKKVRPVSYEISSVTATGFTLTVKYSTAVWDPLSPTNYGTLTTKQVFNFTSSPPAGTTANAFAEVSDVSPDGGKALIVHGCQHTHSLGYHDTIVSCWELTLTDADVTQAAVWSFSAPSSSTVVVSAPAITYIDRYTVHETSGGHENYALNERWSLDTGEWYTRLVGSWLWLACYDKTGARHLVNVGYDYRNYAARYLYTANTATSVTDLNWIAASYVGALGAPEPTWGASPILHPVSSSFTAENSSQVTTTEAYRTGDFNCVKDNGSVVLPSVLSGTIKVVSLSSVEKKTAHVMAVSRRDETLTTDIERFLVAPGVVDSAPLTGDLKATYDARNVAVLQTTDSNILSLAVM